MGEIIRRLFDDPKVWDWGLWPLESVFRKYSSAINQRIFSGDTVLHYVLKNDNCSSIMLHLLLGCGANLYIKDSQDMTPLEIAIRYRRDEASIMLLVALGALSYSYDPYPPYFCLAVRHQAPLLLIDAIISKRKGLDQCGFANHQTLFNCALSSPQPSRTVMILKKLMEAGLSLNVNPEELCAALRFNNSLETLNFLIEKKVELEAIKIMLDFITDTDVKFSDVMGNSLLHTAVQNKNCLSSLVELLIKRGVNVNHVNKLGDTALDEAVLNPECPESVLIILLKNGSNLNPRTVSLSRSDTKLLKLLLATGVSLDRMRYLRELENTVDNISFGPKRIIYFQYLLRYYLLEYSDFDLPFLKNVHTHYNDIIGYRDRCVGELTKLKSQNAGLNYTAIDLLSRNSSLRGAATNMEDKISHFNCLLKAISGYSLPLYRYIIADKVTRPVLEHKIYQTKVYVFKFVERKRIDIVLNSDCLMNAVPHLTDVDLLSLILAFFEWDPNTSSTKDLYQTITAESALEPLKKRFKLDE
ncbi:hypothetical protein JTE90_028930 [Oedothorax gibbosus]|uniref:Ankyrin repeat protein n=1 Tax=Oedothorax gibbosus TaxID=931172 RepID=A0AAV6VK75_9ARAC|nr:hypothetical protein JTE90_028930 [Oedothorax gibbosus]